MLRSAVLAAIAAAPFVVAQDVAVPDVTASATRCTTRFGFYPLPTGTLGTEAVPTWYRFTTTTNIFRVTSVTRDTVTVIPTATTLTDVVITTEVATITTTSTPLATTIPTPAGFIPLVAANLINPTPTAVARVKRGEIEYRDVNLPLLRRQTPANNVGGFIVDRDGDSQSMNRRFAQRVDCRVAVTVNTTQIDIVQGTPETVIAPVGTSRAVSTSTISSTTTVTQTLPRETVYAACQDNNVVNRITGFTGNELVFDRVIYRPAEGFPIANEMIVNTTSAINCCIACQNQPFCAGSFYVPKPSECHLRLTQAAPVPVTPALAARQIETAPYAFNNETNEPVYQIVNGTFEYATPVYQSGMVYASAPTGFVNGDTLSPRPINDGSNSTFDYRNGTYRPTGVFPSGVALPTGTGVSPPLSTGTGSPSVNTCPAGSRSLYLGTIQGQEDFPLEYALSFSNGPCGRLSVWPIPIVAGLDTTLEDRRLRLH